MLKAADGEEGLRIFGANAARINMLLTDVVLPARCAGGWRTDSALRPEVKILFMSGYTENSIVHHGRLEISGVRNICPKRIDSGHPQKACPKYSFTGLWTGIIKGHPFWTEPPLMPRTFAYVRNFARLTGP